MQMCICLSALTSRPLIPSVSLPELRRDNVANGHWRAALTYHGGGFNIGDTHHLFTDHVGYLLQKGFVVVSAEYRMAPQ